MPSLPTSIAAAPTAIVTLTCEQSQSPVLEIRNHQNEVLGYLVKGTDLSLYFSPADMEVLRQRAAASVPGKTLREIREIAGQRAEGRIRKSLPNPLTPLATGVARSVRGSSHAVAPSRRFTRAGGVQKPGELLD